MGPPRIVILLQTYKRPRHAMLCATPSAHCRCSFGGGGDARVVREAGASGERDAQDVGQEEFRALAAARNGVVLAQD